VCLLSHKVTLDFEYVEEHGQGSNYFSLSRPQYRRATNWILDNLQTLDSEIAVKLWLVSVVHLNSSGM
jgi:hypothetical protein